MSSSASYWTTLQPYAFKSVVVVLCFLVTFFVYFNHDKLPSFDFHTERDHPPCPKVMCAAGAQAQDSNCTTELHIKPHHNDTQRIQTAAVDTRPDTTLLVWMWPFNIKYELSCDKYNITGCRLTSDRSLHREAHGVIFHHWDINPGDMPKEPRPWFQKWVWFNVESPANSRRIPHIDNIFNVTCNYRFDADITMRYGYLEPVTSEVESFKLPAKDKLVCWIVSHWNPSFKRVQFYNELKKHINISTYGGGFSKRVSENDYTKIVSSCKFYLSFENSVYKDYITEKLYRPMILGTVPVVLGTSRSNYEDHVPGDSFIHIDDFSTPKELAERLLYLDQNNSEYMRYFDWRNRFKVRRSEYAREHACRTCSYLRKHRQYQTIHALNKWFYG